MSVTYSASLPSTKRLAQCQAARKPSRMRGAAILMAILTVALVAAVASAIIAEHGAAIEQLSGRNEQAQARWLARGAIDWARNVLQFDQVRDRAKYKSDVDFPTEEWTIAVPPMPVDAGEMSGQIEEQSSRFNINTLVNQGIVNPDQQAIFLRLLSNLNISPSMATSLTDAIIDWIDADDVTRPLGAESAWYAMQKQSILPPQTSLLSIDELLSVRGMTPALLQVLKPHISALPPNANSINVNIASAEVLSACIDLPLAQAKQLVQERKPLNDVDQGYFRTVAAFVARLPKGGSYNTAQLSVRSYYFLATGRARWGDSATDMQVLLLRDQGRPAVIRETIL